MLTQKEALSGSTLYQNLCCPICHFAVSRAEDGANLICRNNLCRAAFPIVDDVPVLINEERSLFSLSDFTARKTTTLKEESKLIQLLRKVVPENSHNLKAKENYSRFVDLMLKDNPAPKVLIIGGSLLGRGIGVALENPALEVIETDVALGGRTKLICDAHDIPFADNSLDGVVVQAVLEHVLDPQRCVAEIHRVLKPDGLVYAETPFMQQVHMGRFDFTRFTHLGHRRLFRAFSEVDSGAMCGPGMALAWAYEYLLLSFVKGTPARAAMRAIARLTGFWLKYLDYATINRPGAIDAASGCYFLGRKSTEVLSDRELLKLYKGAMQ